MIRLALAAAALLTPVAASAQAYRCAVPGDLPRPRADGPDTREPKRVVPIGGYTLAITWAAQHCHDNAREASARFQCASGNRFGFTLHGLWPDGTGRQWPQYCRPAPLLGEEVLRRNLCATPSVQLLQHEYAKHGTCMGLPPAQYFARSTGLYGRLRYPDMNALSRRPNLTAGQFATAFARANPGLRANMMRITANRQGWLEEVWLCLDKRFAFAACPAHQGGLKPSARLKIWRGGGA
ncbi:ribonuclease T [Sphingomonas cannabina]|uniref:ribonuclease T2 family protein n=1 Tax=Sphingomonas cannabina TaxID=2899123 RepID=UPI001F3B731E|nr:ribonuclease T [Sphingomonas cannabina]UIJ46603.1 ribonuclease T [Sphingomonas cannabina]